MELLSSSKSDQSSIMMRNYVFCRLNAFTIESISSKSRRRIFIGFRILRRRTCKALILKFHEKEVEKLEFIILNFHSKHTHTLCTAPHFILLMVQLIIKLSARDFAGEFKIMENKKQRGNAVNCERGKFVLFFNSSQLWCCTLVRKKELFYANSEGKKCRTKEEFEVLLKLWLISSLTTHLSWCTVNL